MDGRETTEAIRQWEAAQDSAPVPIVALTAHALANEKRSLLQNGLDDYLTKPIGERQLAQVVLKWTGLPLRQQPTQASERRQPAPGLSVLDHAEGLQLAAGKADLAAELLGMLLDSLAVDRQIIQDARANDAHDVLLQRVHRLHGATRYCGVPQLRAACQHCETLLKQKSPASAAALDDLDAAIEQLLEETGQTSQAL
jgi:two-component system sensor histidine kinase BarA